VQLDDLNPPQREAVEYGDGALLILAGAGSGKTRVITRRLAALVGRGVPPWRILAVTFTNKAAGEMRERAARLLGDAARKLWIGTFHATCARLLRIHAEDVGLRRDFNIYDDDDQKRLVTRVMKDVGVSEQALSPRALLSHIDQAKNQGIAADEYVGESYLTELVARVYPEYQARLRAANAVDFGDLLLEVLHLTADPHAGPELKERFDHVLVDEFQDTNRVQYRLVQELAATKNLCVVGDDDQSIYRWRGADVRNILDFERDYPRCYVVKLEQNYRSTQTILEAANGVIARNHRRRAKRLFTENGTGEPVIYYTAPDERREAEFIVRSVRHLCAEEGRETGDFAVLYRMHAQSRVLEEALRAHDVPYAVLGGVRFFDRAEVRDLLAYLRVVANPSDEVSLERIVNVPPRGIGEATLEKVAAHARAHRLSFWDAMRAVVESRPVKAAPAGEPLFGIAAPETSEPDSSVLGPGPRRKLGAFVSLVESLRERREGRLSDLAAETLLGSGLVERLLAEDTPEARERIGNLEELVNSIRDYEREAGSAGEEPSLTAYLERVSLQSSADGASRGVTLMTIHAAKGLEFPVVFLAGLEEGTFPLMQAGDEHEKLEEERRLAYVAITRARERLVLTNAARRRLYRGERTVVAPTARLDEDDPFSLHESRFVEDIPVECIARPVTPRRSAPPERGSGRIEQRDDGTWIERDEPTAPPRRPSLAAPAGPSAHAGGERRIEYDESGGAPFHVGQRVRHAQFGEGRVRSLSGAGDKLKLCILFPGVGEKNVIARFVEPA
jgi:DNA helicase-2/ATP-dependent DNA helicase PcrA